jgi:hypothetical protein
MSLLSNILEQQPRAEDRRPEVSGAILAVDIGNVYTRAILLDVVDGTYRFVARGESPTTSAPPWNNILEGVQQAVGQVSQATGRRIFDDDGQLTQPERDAYFGVGGFVATASAGQPVRAVLVGLMPEVSLSSGRRAAESTYLLLADSFSLGDKRTPDQQINALLQSRAELILIVGGTDNGAAQSMRRQIETIALACSLMEREHRPVVLYAGNKALQEEVTTLFDEIGVRALVTDNVRPTLDTEKLDSAQASLASQYHHQRSRTTGGYADVGGWTNEGIFPTAHGFSQMIHILGKMNNQNVLGVDLGSSDTTIAAYLNGHHYLNVLDGLGMGHTATGILAQVKPENITRWLSYDPQNMDDVLDAVWNKWLYPQTVPVSVETLEIEYALAREVIRSAALSARASWRDVRQRGPLPPFDTILLTGSTLTNAPNMGWAALVALDALLPLGMTRLVADPYGLAASLGAIADISPRAVVQVLDTGAFLDLATVISISGRARVGEIVLRGSLKPEGASQAETFEVTYGSMITLPLKYGVQADLILQPRHVEVESAQGKKLRKLKITGGELGLIIDARGRPWRFPQEADLRRKLIRQWIDSMTGEKPD